MNHLTTLLATMLMLTLWVSPAYAQDAAPEAAPTEEAAPADAAPAPEGEEAPADADEAEEAPADADEGEAAEEAPSAPTTDEEAVETALSIIDAIKAGQWPLAVGLFLTLLVYFVNRFGLKEALSEKAAPWVAAGVGAAGAIGTGLVTGTPVVDSVVAGVLAAVAAVGGWEMLLKHLTAKKEEEAPPSE